MSHADSTMTLYKLFSVLLVFCAEHSTHKFNRPTLTGRLHVYFSLKSCLMMQVSVSSQSLEIINTLKLFSMNVKCVVLCLDWILSNHLCVHFLDLNTIWIKSVLMSAVWPSFKSVEVRKSLSSAPGIIYTSCYLLVFVFLFKTQLFNQTKKDCSKKIQNKS